jgi:hypothetical protein
MARAAARTKILGILGAVVVLGAAGTAYQVSHRDPPSFRRGGTFAAGQLPTTTTSPTAPAPSPSAQTTSTGPSPATGPPGPAPSAASPGSTTTTAAGPPTTTTKSRTATTPATNGGNASPEATATGAPFPPVEAARPAFGTYSYAVDGEEAPPVGKRRFPDRMTTTIHSGPGLDADQVVADVRYSESHEEREIIGYRDDGTYFDFEGVSITFGPRTETSEGDYDPPVLQVPRPLTVGLTRSGVSQRKDARGSVTNTEDWRVTILAAEPVAVAGSTVQAWKVQVDRKTRPGPGDQATRQRVYWYDPGRALWVKFTETTHAERKILGGTLVYDSHLTATLIGFSAGPAS